MGEIVHTSHITIVREKGPTSRAMIEGISEPVYYGVHGGIKKSCRIDPDKEHAATLDQYGWMAHVSGQGQAVIHTC